MANSYDSRGVLRIYDRMNIRLSVKALLADLDSGEPFEKVVFLADIYWFDLAAAVADRERKKLQGITKEDSQHG